ncbi:hypothetical protein E4665_17105 [Sporolactobacillus shoreae]|uniref:Uncharacterized protein n=1 Tax=Sporolactobacillus shoreae TaxID=1465501 RepID=A0A4Z0GKB0_9BACL|nr:hypothetical protein [Sporolactobacillus shoreae]TGA95986.1 hypothetical protein E4665_17105 [Sporolactobacillus shoreae]
MSPETKAALQKHFDAISNGINRGSNLQKIVASAKATELGELLLILFEDYPEIGEAIQKQMDDFTTESLLKMFLGDTNASINRI